MAFSDDQERAAVTDEVVGCFLQWMVGSERGHSEVDERSDGTT